MAKFDVKLKSVELPELPPVAAKPLYAGVGATDIAVQKVVTYVTDVQAKVTAKVVDVQKQVKGFELPEPKKLQDKAAQAAAERRKVAEARISELRSDVTGLPTTVKAKYDENLSLVTTTYADLVKHGETVLTRIRKGETAAPVEVTKKATPAQRAAARKGGVAATKAPAKKAPAKKAPAKKPAAKKAPAPKAASSN